MPLYPRQSSVVIVEPDSTLSCIKANKVFLRASGTTSNRTRPVPFPTTSTAMATTDLPSAPRPRFPIDLQPTYVSSIYTVPVSFSRPGTTINLRNL